MMCAVALLSAAASGQDRPEALKLGHSLELSGGYAYTHLRLGTTSTNMNGLIGALGINLTPWLQLCADASVQYGMLGISHLRIYGNHFGPRLYLHRPNVFHAAPFAEVLIGGSRIDGTVGGPGGLKFSDNGFSLKAGGGLDFNLSGHFAVRAVNLDYYRTPFLGEHQNNLWLSTGFVIRFGGSRP